MPAVPYFELGSEKCWGAELKAAPSAKPLLLLFTLFLSELRYTVNMFEVSMRRRV